MRGRPSAKEQEKRAERKAQYVKSVLPNRQVYRMTVKAYFKGGYVATRYFDNRAEMRKHIDKRQQDKRIAYIGVIPPQDYMAHRMEAEADKGGYSIEKYQKVFG